MIAHIKREEVTLVGA